MPFKIVRNDITRVAADAIVNTANPEPKYGSGTDAAVYKAAGEEELLAARRKIGRITPGECAVTPAFRLPAKYIIHTVGPAWTDGAHGEFEILRSCYRKALLLADRLGCESIAFPLIAAGVYGFPKDRALDTALDVIREHLEDSDLDVTLVVFNPGAFRIAQGLADKVEAYIDEKNVAAQTAAEYGEEDEERLAEMMAERREADRRRRRADYNASVGFWEKAGAAASAPVPQQAPPAMSQASTAIPAAKPAPSSAKPKPSEAAPAAPILQEPAVMQAKPAPQISYTMPVGAAAGISAGTAAAAKKPSLDEVMKHLGESFQARLLRIIDERGLTDPEVYHRANIDRKLFSKIRCSEDYIPKKKTIVALAIALRLNLDDTKDLLAAAGLTLTNNIKFDLIVSFCIENAIYDIYEVNALLFKFEQPMLG